MIGNFIIRLALFLLLLLNITFFNYSGFEALFQVYHFAVFFAWTGYGFLICTIPE